MSEPLYKLPVEVIVIPYPKELEIPQVEEKKIRERLRRLLSGKYAGAFEYVLRRRLTHVMIPSPRDVSVSPPVSEIGVPLRVAVGGLRYSGLLRTPLNSTSPRFYESLCECLGQEFEPVASDLAQVEPAGTYGYHLGAEIELLPLELREALLDQTKKVPNELAPLQLFLCARINVNDLSFSSEQIVKGLGGHGDKLVDAMYQEGMIVGGKAHRDGAPGREYRWQFTVKGRRYVTGALTYECQRLHESRSEQVAA